MFPDYNQITANSRIYDSSVDTGLRSYFLGIYRLMAAALVITGGVAYWSAQNLMHLMHGPLFWVFALLPLAFVFVLSAGLNRLSVAAAYVLFYVFAASMGISLSTLFAVYTNLSIAKAFFISAGTFAAFSIYGYTTGRDLTKLGSFLLMGLIGVIIAGLVNIFFQSSMASFVISCITVLLFVCFTAYDTQTLKEEYLSNGNVYGFSSQEKSSIFGALQLYLDFINIFVNILELIGVKRD
jgi:uncharacterized protein